MDVDAQAVEACKEPNGGGIVDPKYKSILVIQTAFIGDAILTLPLIQILKKNFPQATLDVVVVPRAADIFLNHPAISEIFPYDKRGKDRGLGGFIRLYKKLRCRNYDLIIVPHRSLRSAILGWILRPKINIGFDRSAGRFLFKKIVRYNPVEHEIDRNLSLLQPLSIKNDGEELPRLYPSCNDVKAVDLILDKLGIGSENSMIAVAPGTIWNTKRWPSGKFAELIKKLAAGTQLVLLVGGSEDNDLCEEILQRSDAKRAFNVAGKLSLLQSAELIGRCIFIVTNDSAPMHIAVATGTPVAAIYGATIPEYGFAPCGKNDIVIEIKGLKCRPCSIHGGKACPIGTFECMKAISPELVISKLEPFLNGRL